MIAQMPTLPSFSYPMRKNMYAFFGLIIFCVTGAAQADQLLLDSGDTISGSLINVKEGLLIWNSPVLGELKIEQTHVLAVQADKPFDLQGDIGLLRQCLLVSNDGRQLLECESGDLALDKWASVALVAEKIEPELPETEKIEKNGEVTLALEGSSGNTEKERYELDATMEFRDGKKRHILGIEVDNEKSRGLETKNEWEVGYQFDYFVTDQWFLTSNSSYEEDEFKDIEHKISLGAGAGYQYFQTTVSSLSSTLGLNYVEEVQTDGTNQDSSAVRVTFDYKWKPFENEMELYHRNEILQTLSGETYYAFESITGVSIPINGYFHSVVEYDYDYNSEPAAGKNTADRKWSLGLRYKW